MIENFDKQCREFGNFRGCPLKIEETVANFQFRLRWRDSEMSHAIFSDLCSMQGIMLNLRGTCDSCFIKAKIAK